jgi:hypothetical protein
MDRRQDDYYGTNSHGGSIDHQLTPCRRAQLVSLFVGALNRPELRFTELLVPWIVIVGALGFLVAWLVVAIMEHAGLSRYVWHLPLFFLALVVLFSSLIGMVVFP